ncbi:MAG: FAD/NAD(P)-binding protein [Candidatus Sulfotelmatobacter sp.]
MEPSPVSDSQVDILIIGGGFSGTMLAVHLLRHTDLSIAVVDRGTLPGRGVAYGSPHRFHLLNVPAGEMSAWSDAPDDFLSWARIHFDTSLQARSFPPRSIYGAYVGSVLEATLNKLGRERFQWIRDEARSLHRQDGRLGVQTNLGAELLASVVVLATGNFPPANPRLPGLKASASLYFQFAWAKNVLEDLPTTGSILLLGSGLTSVDLIMALKSKGFRGVIHVLSHKGLFPRPRRQQRPDEPWPLFWDETSPRTMRGLLRLVRNQVRAAAAKGINWRAVIDSLRPATQEIWRSLPIEEQKRFVRHLRAYWDVHRHRVAPEIADLLDDMKSDGAVRLHTGTATRYCEVDNKAHVHYWDRETRSQKRLPVDRVINCSGSETDCRRIDESFITSLVVQGFARPDRLFLGVDVNEHGALIDYKGTPSHRLYAIGPVRKGCFWETTAVPEIRVQAAALAEHLAVTFERGNSRPGRALKTA